MHRCRFSTFRNQEDFVRNHFQGNWKNKDIHKQFFDWLGTQLGYKEMEDWYKLTVGDVDSFGGTPLLSYYYYNSPSKALQTVYPQHAWMIWRFEVVPKNYWKEVLKDPMEQKKIVEWLGEQLSI